MPEKPLPNNRINRPLNVTDSNKANELMPDHQVWGDSDTFKLISKFSSESAGIMKSTKAMDTGNGCVVQVTTQQRNQAGTYVIAEALTYVPDVTIFNLQRNGEIIGRILRPISEAKSKAPTAQEDEF